MVIWKKESSGLLFFFAKLLHAKPKHASGKAWSREKRGRKSWFAFALDEVRTRQILREKADCKQSSSPLTNFLNIYKISSSLQTFYFTTATNIVSNEWKIFFL